jgi:NTE family protein
MRAVCRCLIVAIAFAFMPTVGMFAHDTQTARPRIALALGGGGALGFAHIGVLRFLEERRIPVHLIAGTSMGGLLAGLYATGHRSEDLEEIVRNTNWDDLFRMSPKFEDRPVVEKQDWNRVTGPFDFQLGKKLSLPAGINPGAPLALLLSRETLSYSDVDNFDDLPIPFRCVATDLISGEAVALREGFLPKALRATIAIPAIFTPVEWNGRILVDGGLVNNLPTDVVKDMGADIVIGVTLQVSPPTTQLKTIPEILRQSVNVSVLQNERRNLSLADIPIVVSLGNRGSSDFSHTQELIEIGYKVAEQYAEVLQPLSLSLTEWDDYLRDMNARRRTVPTSGRLSRVDSPQPGIKENATHELSRRMSAPVSATELEDNLAGLTAATGLPNAFYGWSRVADALEGYRIELEERPGSQTLIRPTFFYQYSPDEPGRFTFRLSSSAILKDSYKSRFLTDISIGDSPGVTFESYYPFNGTSFFMASGFSIERSRYLEYRERGRIDRARNRFAGSLYFGMGTWRHVQVRVGTQIGYDRYSEELSVDNVLAKSTNFANTGFVWVVNTQDSGDFPGKGTRINGSLGWSARQHSYPYLQTDFDHFRLLPSGLSAFTFGKADSSFGRKVSFYDQFAAGGLTNLDAYRHQELRGNSTFTLGGGVMYRAMNPANSAFRPILAGWHEAARLDLGSLGWQTRQSTSVGVFVPTPAGKVGIFVSFDEDGHARFRLSLGSFWNRP